MFEIGFSELILIMALALIVLGPERLPKVASQVGRWLGRARAMARQFREQLEDEVQFEATTKSHSVSTGSAGAGASAVASGAVAAGAVAGASATAGSEASLGEANAAPGEDPDTRHQDYSGAEYTPPDFDYGALHSPAQDAGAVQDSGDDAARKAAGSHEREPGA